MGSRLKRTVRHFQRRKDLHNAHDTLGHIGYKKYDRIVQRYYCPKLFIQVEQYVFGCPNYSINKVSHTKPPGSLLPIDIDASIEAFECPEMDLS